MKHKLMDADNKKNIYTNKSGTSNGVNDDKDTNHDDITIDSSEFEKKAAKKSSEEPSDIEPINDEDSREMSPEAFIKLKAKLTKALAEKQEYLDGWQRAKADYVNFKKQSENEKKEFIKYANEAFVEELMPTLDSFSMAFGNKESWEKVDKNWRTGVEYIYNQLVTALQNNGLKEISPVGETFDPMRDEAIEFVPVLDAKQDHKIISVIQKGYSLNGKMIKAPKVKVGEVKKA